MALDGPENNGTSSGSLCGETFTCSSIVALVGLSMGELVVGSSFLKILIGSSMCEFLVVTSVDGLLIAVIEVLSFCETSTFCISSAMISIL